MLPLLFLVGLFVVASDAGGPSSSSSSGIDPDGTIHLTCEDSIALLPPSVQKPVADAIALGRNKPAMYALADSLEAASHGDVDDQTFAALVVAAHCVRNAADSLPADPVPLSFSPSFGSSEPLTSSTREASYATGRA